MQRLAKPHGCRHDPALGSQILCSVCLCSTLEGDGALRVEGMLVRGPGSSTSARGP